MEIIQEDIDTISFMVRPEGKKGLLKLNVKKSLKTHIIVGDVVYSHKIKEVNWAYKILEVIEERQSSMKYYNYCTYKAELVKLQSN